MRKIKRPLQGRQIIGAHFGEDATLLRISEYYDSRGIASRTEAATNIRVASNPPSLTDSRVSMLVAGGVRIEDLREFFTVEEVNSSGRDRIIYPREGGERFVIVSTARFPNGYSSSLAKREEVQ